MLCSIVAPPLNRIIDPILLVLPILLLLLLPPGCSGHSTPIRTNRHRLTAPDGNVVISVYVIDDEVCHEYYYYFDTNDDMGIITIQCSTSISCTYRISCY